MRKVKNLQEVINCLHEKYYLVKKLPQEAIAWKIDLSKPLIWMLERNVHLEQILRLVWIGSIRIASERLFLSKRLSRNAKWHYANVPILP